MQTETMAPKRSRLDLIGQWVEVKWATGHPFATKKCETCVYCVRGVENDMLCLDLVYDASDGSHKSDMVVWVSILAIHYMRVLTDRDVNARIERFEREFQLGCPHD